MTKILVVDDEEPIRMLYDYELTEEGYKVFTLGEGSRLLEVVAQTRPDLIVLDIRLGNWSGLDHLQDIRNTVYNMPVILCTAFPDFKYDLRAIAADYFVIKRSDLKELKNKIKMALEGTMYFFSQAGFDCMQQGKISYQELS